MTSALETLARPHQRCWLWSMRNIRRCESLWQRLLDMMQHENAQRLETWSKWREPCEAAMDAATVDQVRGASLARAGAATGTAALNGLATSGQAPAPPASRPLTGSIPLMLNELGQAD